MRRILIFFYWIFKPNTVGFLEMFAFMTKPKVAAIGERYISSITQDEEYYVVSCKELSSPFYWPQKFGTRGIYQVAAETFDKNDWHYYQGVFRVLPADIVLDVGAAEGIFALSVVGVCKRVILIEPNPNFVKALELTFKPYREKIEIIEVAVGEKSGSTILSDDALSGSITPDAEIGNRVEVKTIDQIIGDREINFLKADIEGFELKMLKGAARTIARNKPRIVITTYHGENNPDEIINLILSYVPEYHVKKQGVFHEQGKPVTVHFWLSEVE
jgi:FkbM family methyltransferase